MDFFQKVKNYAKMNNTTIEDFVLYVFEGTKDRDSFNGWRRRNVLPRADEAVKIAKAMGTTVEELVDGDAGSDYVQQLIIDKGLLWKPPSRIADIVDVLNVVDDNTLDTVRTMVLPLKEKKGDSVSDLAAG
jgi:hypothetical protein